MNGLVEREVSNWIILLDKKRVEITKVENGVLHYAKSCSKYMYLSSDQQWKCVIKSKEEQERMTKAWYASPEGKLLIMIFDIYTCKLTHVLQSKI